MAIALMSLGQNIFYTPMIGEDTPGYDALQRDSSFTWVPQGRLNAPIAMQFTGPGQDVVVIEGKIFPHHFGGTSTLDALRAAGAAGKPQELVRYYPVHDADGNLLQGTTALMLGAFVIMRVRTGEKNIASSGVANSIDFQLELAAYGNDGALGSQTATVAPTGN